MRYFLLIVLAMCLMGCAGQTYKPPSLSAARIATFEETSLESAIEKQTARLKRAHQLFWPLLSANTALCPKTRQSVGMLISDRQSLGQDLSGITASQLALVGVPEQAYLFDVMVGGPAWNAGLRPKDRLVGVSGQSYKDTSGLRRAISDSLKKDEALRLIYQRGDIRSDVTIAPIEVCDAALRVVEGDTLNAYAGTRSITLYAGLMREMDDDALQFILAHELSHVALRHVRKGTRNVIVSGGFLYIPVLTIFGRGADSVLDRADSSREISLSAKALALAPNIELFEAEADYVGLYMLVRAGGRIEGALEAFEIFSREKPNSIWVRYTHPLTPERLAAVKQTALEIEEKKQKGEVILPNKVAR